MPSTLDVPLREPGVGAPAAAGIEVRGASVVYRPRRRAAIAALRDLDLTVAEHEIVGVVGPSGCGKSTLLDLVCGLRRPDAGSVRAAPAVLMPQGDSLLPWLDAIDNAALALRVRGEPRGRARELAAPLFERFGLSGFEHSRPAELSGGMRQRVAFLRTLLAGKPVLALDEPFAALDALTRREMQAWLVDALAAEPRTVLLVTHDVEEAVAVADRVLVLSERPGRVIDELPVGLPQPRRRADAAFLELRERAAKALGAAE